MIFVVTRFIRPLLLLCLSVAKVVYAQSPQPAAQQLLEQLQNIQTFKAQFSQILYDERGTMLAKSSGHVRIMRPGRFKWLVQKPAEQVLVADGVKLWIYDADLEQVTVYNQAKQLQATPAAFLSEQPEVLLKHYHVHALDAAGTRFSLLSEDKDSALVRLVIRFENKQMKQLQMIDPMEQLTVLEFNKIQQNQPMAAKIFVFKPPSGVDVIDNTRASQP